MKLRAPAIDPGLTAFLWALVLSLYLWLFQLAVGVDTGTATVLSGLAFFAIFLYVRLYGEDELPVRYQTPRERR